MNVADITLHYVEVPSTLPTAVLLHGVGVDWRVWQAIARRLYSHFHLLIPDLRGHGRSDKPVAGYSLTDYASDVELLLDNLQLSDVALVGSSLGGLIALAVESPLSTVSKRVLVDPPLTTRPGPSRELFHHILAIKSKGIGEDEERVELSRALLIDNPSIGGLQLKYLTETWLAVAPGVLTEMLKGSQNGWMAVLEPHLSTIDSPVLIMRANPELGGVLSEASARRASAALSEARIEYFERAGHAIHGTQPVAFVDSLLRFCHPVVSPDSNISGAIPS